MANYNIGRLAEDIKREISVAIRDIKDSAVTEQMVSVTRCELTNDLSYCKVYISGLGQKGSVEKAAERLQAAEGFFKKRINSRIKMRKLPKLTFIPDLSQEYYERISKVLDSLPKPDQAENEDNGEE